MEMGDVPIPITDANFFLNLCGTRLTLECWNESRNLMRRVRSTSLPKSGRLEVEVERFGNKPGILTLADLAHASNRELPRKGSRLRYREIMRRALRRQFPDWRLADLSTEPDLEHSLSPAYTRALLCKGGVGLAAIGAGPESLDPDGALTFGLIWLDYLRRREAKLAMQGLVIFLPAGREETTCHRLRFLNPRAGRFSIFRYYPEGLEDAANPGDYTNFDSRVDPHRQSDPRAHHESPEAWLEARVRANIETIDPALFPQPVYGQVPQFAAGQRGIVDLLAVDRDGRLAVIELKASQDIHLPLQALDYWMRVCWHLERGEFANRGYFPGIALRPDPPRLLLVAPALDFHPTNEQVVRYFSPTVQVERIGVGLEWRKKLRVMFRSSGLSSFAQGHY